ncbi:hypothetical protein PIB30_090635 [Stylosanthes scabra]|uniref:Uncharacterized protein n=1 Tax=Stylosanthes scabra TaxID=79078 RepID=A0ABU6RUN6_9FABA|nr:hypothetical protein [Stylosanthes scabra]
MREFYANARIDPNNEVGPRFHTFVRGMLVNFSMDRIKTIMKFEGPLNSETSYRARMVEGNQDQDAVTRDICVEGAVWSLGARNNPLYLKRSDLNPVARGVASTTSIPTRCEKLSRTAKGAVPILQKEQEKMQKELTNYKKNFSSHMGKLHAAHEEQKTKMGQTNQVLVNHALYSQAGNMYTHWALQQANQNLVPMIPTKILQQSERISRQEDHCFTECYALGHQRDHQMH